MTRTTRWLFVGGALTCVAISVPPVVVSAQQGLQSASGTSTLLTRTASVLTADLKETGLTLLLKSSVSTDAVDWFGNTTLSVAAEKNKRALYSKGEFVPGAKVEHRFAQRRLNDDYGYMGYYVSGAVDVAARPIARYTDATKTELKLQDIGSTITSAGIGVNWLRNPTAALIGIGGTFSNATAAPSASRPIQVCTVEGSALDAKGNAVTAARCKERFVGELATTRSGQVRLDYVGGRFPQRRLPVALSNAHEAQRRADEANVGEAEQRVAELEERAAAVAQQLRATLDRGAAATLADVTAALRADRAASEALQTAVRQRDANRRTAEQHAQTRLEERRKALEGPTFGWIAATSADMVQRKKTAYNVAIGPAIYSSLAPDVVLGAFLFEVTDATNASGEVPKRWDRFSIRLQFGVPF